MSAGLRTTLVLIFIPTRLPRSMPEFLPSLPCKIFLKGSLSLQFCPSVGYTGSSLVMPAISLFPSYILGSLTLFLGLVKATQRQEEKSSFRNPIGGWGMKSLLPEVWIQGQSQAPKLQTNNTLGISALSLVLPLTQSTLCQAPHLSLVSIRPTKSPPQEIPGCNSEKASEVHMHLRKSSAS